MRSLGWCGHFASSRKPHIREVLQTQKSMMKSVLTGYLLNLNGCRRCKTILLTESRARSRFNVERRASENLSLTVVSFFPLAIAAECLSFMLTESDRAPSVKMYSAAHRRPSPTPPCSAFVCKRDTTVSISPIAESDGVSPDQAAGQPQQQPVQQPQRHCLYTGAHAMHATPLSVARKIAD